MMGYDFTKAVANLAKGCRLRRDGDDGWEMVMPVPNPDGATIDRLMREGWLEMMPNGGTAKISDAGLKAYLRATDEMGRGVLEMTPQKTKVPTCPDCEGLGYLGGEDTPSSCMNKYHKLALNESFERVAKVAEERAAFAAGIEAAANALEADAQQCDCFARMEVECGCGAWDDNKLITSQRAIELVRALQEQSK